jgi:hypothetical protein
MSDDRLRRNPEPPAAPASANPFPPSRSPGLFDGGQFNWGRSRHGDVYGVLGGGRLIDEFRQGTPSPASSCRTTAPVPRQP